MSFTYKIMLGPLATAVAFLVIFGVTEKATQDSSRTIGRIQDEFFHASELSHDLQLQLLSMRHLLTTAVATGDRDILQQTDDLAGKIHDTMTGCSDVPSLAEVMPPLAAKFGNYYDQARQTTERLISDAAGPRGESVEDLSHLVQQMNRSYADLSSDLGEIVARNNDQLALAIAEMRTRISDTRRALNIGSVVFLVLLVLLSTLVVGSIVRPVHRMNRLARAISGGDLGQSLDYHSGDAIGELADSFREMQKSLIDDIARRQKAESDLIATQGQMIQTEKMAVLGKLVAGLTHELNTPLGAMRASLDVMRRSHEIIESGCAVGTGEDAGPGEDRSVRASRAMEQALTNLNQATGRIAELVNGLKVFSQLDKGEVQQTDLNEGLRATLTLVEHDLPDGVEIVRQMGELEPVLGYPAQLNQAFIVLLRHATRDTTPPGTVTVCTEQLADHVRVTIADTGCGYDPEALVALFNPSFRAETGRMHMDWEMVSSRRVIERHQGTISATSEVGHGTRYVVEIPVWPDLAKISS